MRRLAFVVGIFISVGVASAQTTFEPATPQQVTADQNSVGTTPSAQGETQISGGYSNVAFNHANGVSYNTSGPYIDTNIALCLPNVVFPIFGVGIGASGYFDSSDSIFGSNYSDVNMVSFEARVAFPFPATQNQGLFIIPRLGMGFLVDNYLFQVPTAFGGVINSYDTGGAFEIRPGIQAGYRFGRAALSVDASYMAAWGGFGKLGDMAQEFRIGLAFSYRF
jgi:hypothetical protein